VQRRHEPVKRHYEHLALDALDAPGARQADHRTHTARVPATPAREPARRSCRPGTVGACVAQRLGFDHEADA